VLLAELVLAFTGMKSAFAELGKSDASDLGTLSAAFGDVLRHTITGMRFSFIGLILLAMALFYHKYRRAWVWFFFVIAVLSACGLLYLLTVQLS